MVKTLTKFQSEVNWFIIDYKNKFGKYPEFKDIVARFKDKNVQVLSAATKASHPHIKCITPKLLAVLNSYKKHKDRDKVAKELGIKKEVVNSRIYELKKQGMIKEPNLYDHDHLVPVKVIITDGLYKGCKGIITEVGASVDTIKIRVDGKVKYIKKHIEDYKEV